MEDVECEEDGSDASESAGRALSPLALPFDSLLSTMSWADQVVNWMILCRCYSTVFILFHRDCNFYGIASLAERFDP